MTAYLTIDDYLDDLDRLLKAPPREKRRILSEVADHLSIAAAERVDAGVQPAAALAIAIKTFGTPRVVARSFAGRPGRFESGAAIAFQFVPVLAIGLFAIALSGVLALAASGPWGQEFISGNSDVVRSELAYCAELIRDRGIDGCASTALTQRFEATILLRVAAGALGIAVLLAWAVACLVFRNRPSVRNPRLVPAVATTLFGVVVFISVVTGLARLWTAQDAYGAGSSLTLAAALLLPLGWYASRLLSPPQRE